MRRGRINPNYAYGNVNQTGVQRCVTTVPVVESRVVPTQVITETITKHHCGKPVKPLLDNCGCPISYNHCDSLAQYNPKCKPCYPYELKPIDCAFEYTDDQAQEITRPFCCEGGLKAFIFEFKGKCKQDIPDLKAEISKCAFKKFWLTKDSKTVATNIDGLVTPYFCEEDESTYLHDPLQVHGIGKTGTWVKYRYIWSFQTCQDAHSLCDLACGNGSIVCGPCENFNLTLPAKKEMPFDECSLTIYGLYSYDTCAYRKEWYNVGTVIGEATSTTSCWQSVPLQFTGKLYALRIEVEKTIDNGVTDLTEQSIFEMQIVNGNGNDNVVCNWATLGNLDLFKQYGEHPENVYYYMFGCCDSSCWPDVKCGDGCNSGTKLQLRAHRGAKLNIQAIVVS